nr:MAG TPA: hypothetical protein [Bacteriophage sp.]
MKPTPTTTGRLILIVYQPPAGKSRRNYGKADF